MTTPRTRGEKERDRKAAAAREVSAETKDIGELPKVVNPRRKKKCRANLRLFCETYLRGWFYLGWSAAHLRALDKLQACILEGGLFAMAFPRGDGKTTMSEAAALWALLYGWRRFLVVVAANKTPLAEAIIRELKELLEESDPLFDDFPEVCYPIRRLQRIAQRANGQTYKGKPTRMVWTGDEIAFAHIPKSAAAGAAIRAVGITGAVRGAKRPGPNGQSIRPDLVILDDPQDRESAKSPTQTSDRLAIVRGDVLGLAGPDKAIAAIMPCTIIYPGDLAAQLLDHEKNPEWQGEKTATLTAWPADLPLWDEYWEARSGAIAAGRGKAAGNEWYLANQPRLDAGAEVYWADRVRKGDVSAVQSAMNLYYRDRRAFFAEYQNAPLTDSFGAGAKQFTADAVAGRLTGCERLQVPAECTRLTAFIDVGSVLWYAVVAWNESFGGAVVDYGCWPAQSRTVFAAADARPTLLERYPNRTLPQAVHAGLQDLAIAVLSRPYFRQGGGEARVEVCLVDSGWEKDMVFQWVRQAPKFSCPVHPSKGFGRGTTSRGVSEWARREGERIGHHWKMTTGEKDKTRSVQYDTDVWKTVLHTALTGPPGGKTGLALFGTAASAHQLLGLHCWAEYSTPATIRGATFDKWDVRPDRPDNHLFDCLVGAMVAASVAGLTWTATGSPPAPPSTAPRLRYADVKAQREAKQPPAADAKGPEPAKPAASPAPGKPKRMTFREQRKKLGLP